MIEHKIRYDGTTADFECGAIRLEKNFIELSYVVTGTLSVGPDSAEMSIPAGTMTFAFYWVDRPYTVYLWRDFRWHTVLQME